MKRIVAVTGAAGFVGKKLTTRLLESGFEVLALDITDPEIDGATFKYCDISREWTDSPLDLPEGLVVVHLAALSTDPLCKNDPIAALNINLTGTARIVNRANERKCSKFIFASSEWVYPETDKEHLQLEDEELSLENLKSLYAMTKLMGENLIRSICTIPFTILRFGIVYGPRKKPGSAPESIAFKISKGEDVSIGAGKTARRFIYVDDLVDGIKLAVEENPNPTNEVYNLAGEKLISLNEVAQETIAFTGSKSQIIDCGSIPSIRNPETSKFHNHFDTKPLIPFSEGIQKCIVAMNDAK